MDIVQLAPRAALRPHLRRIAGFSERSAPVRRREVPLIGVALVLSTGPDLWVDGGWTGSFAGGLYDRPIVTGHGGERSGLQLDVSLPAARALLGVPLGELANRTVPLADLIADAAEVTERVALAPDWRSRAAVADALLGPRLAGARPFPEAVIHAYRRLLASGGRVRVETLARETGWSRRHLSATFAREVGLPPKAFARLARFERAVGLLRAGRELADVAYACGYADQPHMNRDFRAFLGAPPSRLPFVQDGIPAA